MMSNNEFGRDEVECLNLRAWRMMIEPAEASGTQQRIGRDGLCAHKTFG